MKCKMSGEELIVYLEGRIDSTNCESIEKELLKLVENKHSALTLNFLDILYISSAGLRILLRLAKKEKHFRCVELSSEVYGIMEITGFTEIINIKKAYKHISIDGKKIIGKGAHGTVYRLDDERIVKVYNDSDSIEAIQNEKALARIAFVMGLPTAISYDIVKIDDLYGAIFELLDATSMIKSIQEGTFTIDECVQMSVDIMKRMHQTEVTSSIIPKIMDQYIQIFEYCKGLVPIDVYDKCIQLLKELNDFNYLIHGDFHFKNILMQNEEPMLIDMDTLSKGHPIFEFVPIYMAYVGYGEIEPKIIENFMGIPYEQTKQIWKRTIELYFGNDKNVDKIRLLSYFRLLKRANKHHLKEEEYYRQMILDLYKKVDTFKF